MIHSTDLGNLQRLLHPVHVLRAKTLVSFRGVLGCGGGGGGGGCAYDDHYFSIEGEETLEALELSLGFYFGSHDVRCQSKMHGNFMIHFERKG